MADAFTTETAKKTGKSERTIQRAAHLGAQLGAATLKRIVGTSLDKGTALEALVAMSPEEREKTIQAAESGENIRFTRRAASAAASPPAAKPKTVEPPVEQAKPSVPRPEAPVDILRKAMWRIEQDDLEREGPRHPGQADRLISIREAPWNRRSLS